MSSSDVSKKKGEGKLVKELSKLSAKETRLTACSTSGTDAMIWPPPRKRLS